MQRRALNPEWLHPGWAVESHFEQFDIAGKDGFCDSSISSQKFARKQASRLGCLAPHIVAWTQLLSTASLSPMQVKVGTKYPSHGSHICTCHRYLSDKTEDGILISFFWERGRAIYIYIYIHINIYIYIYISDKDMYVIYIYMQF